MNNETLLIAPAPAPAEEIGAIDGADAAAVITADPGAAEGVIGGADGPTAVFTTEVGVAENIAGAVEILGQGMASIFVVLGLIAVVVAVLKKLDNKKK